MLKDNVFRRQLVEYFKKTNQSTDFIIETLYITDCN